jgi:phage terminase Nu1 subunit (DNA packaging protein)
VATINEVAKHIGVSAKYVQDLINDGVIERQGRGQYDLDVCRQAYITKLRETAAGRAANGELDLGEERARLAKEQADAKEMENEVQRGALVYIEDVAGAIEKQFTKVRTKLLAVPTKVAPEAHACATVKEVQGLLEQSITEALNDLVGLDAADTEEEA